MTEVFFFIGKGGVGKTTLSSALSFYLAEQGNPTLLVSLDPAHNLFDFFDLEPVKGPFRIKEDLWILEIDEEEQIRDALKEVTERMKQTYRHLQILNLEGMFDVLKYSPGMLEHALLVALDETLRQWKGRVRYFVVDTPPTGLAMRLFGLPRVSMLWLKKLRELRRKILKRRDEITSVRGKSYLGEDVSTEEDEDPVMLELLSQYEVAEEMDSLLRDRNRSRKSLVVNHEELSMREAIMIAEEFRTLGLGIDLVVYNKAAAGVPRQDIHTRLRDLTEEAEHLELPHFGNMESLRARLSQVGGTLAEKLLRDGIQH